MVGLSFVIACATTINGTPPDNGGDDGSVSPAGDADPDAIGTGTDDSTTSMQDTGASPMDDVGIVPMDGPLAPDGAPANDGASPIDGASPTDSAPDAAPPMDSGPPMDAPATMDSPTPPMDSSPPVDSGGMCPIKPTLPYPVDGNGTTQPGFIASGYDGDYCAVTMSGTPGACPGHVLPSALGRCWSATVTTPVGACTDGGTKRGTAGVRWQYPLNNWSQAPPGLNICGATKVTFWAKGALGGETVSFYAGNTAVYQARLPNQVLSNSWMQYTLTFAAPGPDSNVTQGFFWSVNEPAAAGGTVSFMIDDMKWQ